jgi:sugar phosphate isomerase/epimerase
MIKKLGFTKFAYDWRDEHIPTFDDEIAALRRERVELIAWWFPPELNDTAKKILATLKRHELKVQLWVALGDPAPPSTDQSAKVAAAANILRPIAKAAAGQGCTVGLYNHGGWCGEPENQLAILDELKLPNVGLVYNLHHGHDHVARLPRLLEKMKPYLLTININGMDRDGEHRRRKILPVGQGELDLELLRTIQQSGYSGPIGILGHTQDDAELRLRDNLDGLAWLVNQLEGFPASLRPTPRTPMPEDARHSN